jgi:hypothetical protein
MKNFKIHIVVVLIINFSFGQNTNSVKPNPVVNTTIPSPGSPIATSLPAPGGTNSSNNVLNTSVFTPNVTAPNVAAFQRVNFSNVGEYSGTAKVNIPLHEIKVGDITIPISLNYLSSGIKLEDIASNVGQNWSLSAGGSVSKVIKGMDDFKADFKGPYMPLELVHITIPIKYSDLGNSLVQNPLRLKGLGWLMQNEPLSFKKYFDLGAGSADRVITKQDIENESIRKDTYPDLFFANAPGLSTEFCHKKDGSVFEMEKQGNKISTIIGQTEIIPFFNEFKNTEFQFNSSTYNGGIPRRLYGVTKVNIIGINGAEYVFDNLDVNQYANRDVLNHYSDPDFGDPYLTSQEIMAYHLSKIKDYRGNEVFFEYEKYSIAYSEFKKTASFQITTTQQPLIQSLNSLEIKYPVLNRIKKIRYAGGTVEFFYEKARLDLPGDYALSKIEIRDMNTNLIKTIVLDYDYMLSDTNCGTPNCKRLRLLTVQQIGRDNLTIPPYRFFYNDNILLPEKGSGMTDYLGYANASTNTINSSNRCLTCLPSPPRLYYSFNQKRLAFAPFNIFGLSNGFELSGRSLTPSFEYTNAGMCIVLK